MRVFSNVVRKLLRISKYSIRLHLDLIYKTAGLMYSAFSPFSSHNSLAMTRVSLLNKNFIY